jgi:hypothetical protein
MIYIKNIILREVNPPLLDIYFCHGMSGLRGKCGVRGLDKISAFARFVAFCRVPTAGAIARGARVEQLQKSSIEK